MEPSQDFFPPKKPPIHFRLKVRGFVAGTFMLGSWALGMWRTLEMQKNTITKWLATEFSMELIVFYFFFRGYFVVFGVEVLFEWVMQWFQMRRGRQVPLRKELQPLSGSKNQHFTSQGQLHHPEEHLKGLKFWGWSLEWSLKNVWKLKTSGKNMYVTRSPDTRWTWSMIKLLLWNLKTHWKVQNRFKI